MREHGGSPSPAVDLPPSSHLFPLPDLSLLKDGEYGRDEEFQFPFPKGNGDLTGRVTYHMNDKPAIEIKISAFDADGKKALSFGGIIGAVHVTNDMLPHSEQDERDAATLGKNMRATIYLRLVEPEYRKRGLGETTIRLLEETILRVGDAQPNLKPRWIQVITGLESTSNLIVDPNWLAEWLDAHYDTLRYDQLNRLLDRAKHTSVNLGYVPIPGHEAEGIATLTNGGTDLDDRPSNAKDTLFYKKIDPTLTIRPGTEFY